MQFWRKLLHQNFFQFPLLGSFHDEVEKAGLSYDFQFPLLGSQNGYQSMKKESKKPFNSPYWVLIDDETPYQNYAIVFQFPLLGSRCRAETSTKELWVYFQFPLLGSQRIAACYHPKSTLPFNSPYWVQIIEVKLTDFSEYTFNSPYWVPM